MWVSTHSPAVNKMALSSNVARREREKKKVGPKKYTKSEGGEKRRERGGNGLRNSFIAWGQSCPERKGEREREGEASLGEREKEGPLKIWLFSYYYKVVFQHNNVVPYYIYYYCDIQKRL